MDSRLTIPVIQMDHAIGLDLPSYASAGAAGMDLTAANPADAPLIVPAGKWAAIPTGLKTALPDGFEAQIRPRSGLAFKHGVTVLNAPGTIDSDYRGEILIALINHGEVDFEVVRGMRIAQMIIAPVTSVNWSRSTRFESSVRGDRGFGSTGSGIGDLR